MLGNCIWQSEPSKRQPRDSAKLSPPSIETQRTSACGASVVVEPGLVAMLAAEHAAEQEAAKAAEAAEQAAGTVVEQVARACVAQPS